MSVLNYLDNLAKDAILKEDEKKSICKSILNLDIRLKYFFENEISETLQFGSSKRETILPRKMDENSDIDYMVIFTNSSYEPQTYLNKLKSFADKYYQASTVAQSSPAIVIELNHIKFELVPAIKNIGLGDPYKIPGKQNSYTKWIYTNPNDFSEKLIEKNIQYSFKLKPMIRLMKYWNALNNHPFDSYLLEKHISEHSYTGLGNIKDMLYEYISYFAAKNDASQTTKDKVQKLKNSIKKIKDYEAFGDYKNAELEIKKLFPEVIVIC